MQVSNQSDSDQRQFFRINDELFMDYQEIDESEIEDLVQNINQRRSAFDSPLQAQLNPIQNSLTLLIEQINKTDRNTAKAVKLLNDKINFLSHAILKKEHPNNTSLKVNLSGGGLSLLSHREFKAKSTLDIKIELHTSAVIIRAVAKVISCVRQNPENTETPYHLRLIFTYMHELDRDLLIKHILYLQSEALRTNNPKFNLS